MFFWNAALKLGHVTGILVLGYFCPGILSDKWLATAPRRVPRDLWARDRAERRERTCHRNQSEPLPID